MGVNSPHTLKRKTIRALSKVTSQVKPESLRFGAQDTQGERTDLAPTSYPPTPTCARAPQREQQAPRESAADRKELGQEEVITEVIGS